LILARLVAEGSTVIGARQLSSHRKHDASICSTPCMRRSATVIAESSTQVGSASLGTAVSYGGKLSLILIHSVVSDSKDRSRMKKLKD
jgi:hypothetical protein